MSAEKVKYQEIYTNEEVQKILLAFGFKRQIRTFRYYAKKFGAGPKQLEGSKRRRNAWTPEQLAELVLETTKKPLWVSLDNTMKYETQIVVPLKQEEKPNKFVRFINQLFKK